MNIAEWFGQNCVYAPTKEKRKIVRDVIAAQYPNELDCIADRWNVAYEYVIRGVAAKFALSSAPKGHQYSVDDFLSIFCWDDTADFVVDLDSIL